MRILNKYTYLLFGLILIIGLAVAFVIPNFQTEEFSQEVIDDIIQGVTTTTIIDLSINESEEDINNDNEEVENLDDLVITESEKDEIEEILKNNISNKEIKGFDTYLLIGSDARSAKTMATRGVVQGKRADVIILGLIDKETNETTLLSFPRDLLIINTCSNELERINASFNKNNCGNGAENLAAAIYSISGLRVDHFASFEFEGFEKIIDSVGGIEICVEKTQKEGYAFELQKGCQITNGLTTLNWVVSRSTEILVGEKTLDENGNDNSEWKLMPGVSDLTRIERQQYVVIQLIKELSKFDSINELNQFITALENTFVIDENLSINKAVELLWSFRDFNLSNVNKFTVPVDFLTLKDGRQVLVLNDNLYSFLLEKSIINP